MKRVKNQSSVGLYQSAVILSLGTSSCLFLDDDDGAAAEERYPKEDVLDLSNGPCLLLLEPPSDRGAILPKFKITPLIPDQQQQHLSEPSEVVSIRDQLSSRPQGGGGGDESSAEDNNVSSLDEYERTRVRVEMFSRRFHNPIASLVLREIVSDFVRETTIPRTNKSSSREQR